MVWGSWRRLAEPLNIAMKRTHWLVLIITALVVAVLGAYFIQSPGYMDADYYFATARQIASGDGMVEPFIWNYLTNPVGIPQASHQYWLPLTTFLTALPLMVFGDTFRAAQLPWIILFPLLPVLTATIALRLHQDGRFAFIAGLLSIFPGFYFPFFFTTDMFLLYALIGSSMIVLADISIKKAQIRFMVIAGFLVGLANLARADGFLLLLPLGLAALHSNDRKGWRLAGGLAGYIAVMIWWWLRNSLVFGAPFPSGSARSLWLLDYAEIFSYPATSLTPQRWLASGWGEIAGVRLRALTTNIQRLTAENGLVFLGPLMVIGAWNRRRAPIVQMTALYLFVLLIVMSVVFPFIGANGGFFHSSAAVMPVLWALVPYGLNILVRWIGNLRGWDKRRSERVFQVSIVAGAILLTLGLFSSRVVRMVDGIFSWNLPTAEYQLVGEELARLDSGDGLVAINNPPGFFNVTDRAAIVIPNGDEQVLRAALTEFGVQWVVLDRNHPIGLQAIYENPEQVQWLQERAVVAGFDLDRPLRIFEVIGGPDE